MKIKVIGKVHLKGTRKKTGNPYDFIQVYYNGPACGVEGLAALTGACASAGEKGACRIFCFSWATFIET